jgi:hypothetical protein
MNDSPHPAALLIKELNFRGRKITFKATDIEDSKHTYRNYDERGIENYDHQGLPYFICYDFEVYKNEFDFSNNEPYKTFIIKTTPIKKHRFPNNHKINLNQFNKDIKIFHYNKIDFGNTHYSKREIFEKLCNDY